ncbi:ABC transporter ATP-binding protein [Teichococcus aestuarii]|uniref:Methionine ABC transporter ATP-binding protein n=1 Tax=Teichococcus aestuarii TaxID=568898 RepID=A0A2U1UZT3_9PROT|nr:ABC transporter ATP-binding protein [Pseudoroseomonas aestuarii]PWC27154.1 methionine ABC transporter ATP-binding protein [Pseudoroseomonas aestuarii]
MSTLKEAPPALEVRGLRTQFPGRQGLVRAVDGVSFAIRRGEILGLVGESGSGKSVTGFSILGLVEPPGKVVAGEVLLAGRRISGLDGAAMRRIRGAEVAMVFQDPLMTLNPVLRIGTQMAAAVRAHDRVSRAAAWDRAEQALTTVGIPSPRARLDAYPHQLSGGMRQRVAIATALLHRPKAIIADEPTTALDVSIQGQILAEVRRLADETGTAFLWITHDLAVVSSLADALCVMYAGRVVERGPADAVIAAPRHPYTVALVGSVPSGHAPGARLPQLAAGLPPRGADGAPDSGCPFRTRCPRATEVCAAPPPERDFGAGHTALCHHPVEAAA